MIFIDTCMVIDYINGKIKISDFPMLDIDQDIMDLSTKLLNRYTLSHGMTIYDSIIASTCMVYDLPLWSYNKKDFRFLDIELVDL